MADQDSSKTKGESGEPTTPQLPPSGASPTTQTKGSSEEEPKLRHEFVGMMFAVTAAEVGLQVAAVVQRDHGIHYLPAYTHLLLATIIVGASWVGWSLSPSPGARQDVHHVLHPAFLVLLTDVALVIIYFILVRSVDFGAERNPPYIASVPRVIFWIVVMFAVYFFWDLIAKFPFFYKRKFDVNWIIQYGTRILATAICLSLAVALKWLFGDPDRVHYIPADFTLLCLILLFRALKDVCTAFFPTKSQAIVASQKKWAVSWTIGCLVFMVAGIIWTRCPHPLPSGIAQEIQKELTEEKQKRESREQAPARPQNNHGDPQPATN
jgi:hypothetical protein